MDDERFDAIIRGLAQDAGSRRGILQSVAVGLTGLGVSALGMQDVEGKGKKKKK